MPTLTTTPTTTPTTAARTSQTRAGGTRNRREAACSGASTVKCPPVGGGVGGGDGLRAVAAEGRCLRWRQWKPQDGRHPRLYIAGRDEHSVGAIFNRLGQTADI